MLLTTSVAHSAGLRLTGMNDMTLFGVIVVLPVSFFDRDPDRADQHVVDRRALRPPGVQFSDLLGIERAVRETRSRSAVRGVRRDSGRRYRSVLQLAPAFQARPANSE